MGYYGDYIGFQFGEHHSRDLGVLRVSDGNRYNDVSVPNFTDTATKIPGGDGTYYWDSFYTQRTFTVQVAFDNLSEAQVRQFRQVFNGKAEDWLIFDETPYKKYRVKLQGPPQFKYLTFREGERARVYKGEATLTFISYYPYGIDNFKYLSAAPSSLYPNVDEWKNSVNLLADDSILGAAGSNYYVYNPGDLPTDVTINCTVSSTSQNILLQLCDSNNVTLGMLRLEDVTSQGSDTVMMVDSARNLIYGAVGSVKSGNLYNKFIVAGDFFKIPVDTSVPTTSAECNYITAGASDIITDCSYNYLYF